MFNELGGKEAYAVVEVEENDKGHVLDSSVSAAAEQSGAKNSDGGSWK